jgi:hypothetical protein
MRQSDALPPPCRLPLPRACALYRLRAAHGNDFDNRPGRRINTHRRNVSGEISSHAITPKQNASTSIDVLPVTGALRPARFA